MHHLVLLVIQEYLHLINLCLSMNNVGLFQNLELPDHHPELLVVIGGVSLNVGGDVGEGRVDLVVILLIVTANVCGFLITHRVN